MKILVAGAGGFIGGHLVRRLLDDGHEVRAADIKPISKWWQVHDEAAYWDRMDLRLRKECMEVCGDIDWVFNLAADMGGIGYIETHKADCMVSVLINTHLLLAAVYRNCKRFFYASSACAYHADRQNDPNVTALTEADAYHNGGAMPEDGYGWEKLFSERMCRHFTEDYGLETRVARFHNIYGPHGSWHDGREKAPAALCRKVAEVKLAGKRTVEVWGNGSKTRSFCYIGDCVEGVCRLMESDVREPLNVGSSELVSIVQLLAMIEETADYRVTPVFDLTKPQGVAGRNSDNTLIKELLKWEPQTSLTDGLRITYDWIERQVLGTQSH